MKTCLVTIGFGHLFCPAAKFFVKIFASLKFTLAAHLYLLLFIGSQPTPLTDSVSQSFVYHSLGKTEQVLFLNACKITIIQTRQ